MKNKLAKMYFGFGENGNREWQAAVGYMSRIGVMLKGVLDNRTRKWEIKRLAIGMVKSVL